MFADLGRAEVEEVAALFREERYEKDRYIFHEGDPADWVYLVADGKVKIVKQAPTGRETILEVWPPGEIFGGAAILAEHHPASAAAMERATVLKLSRQDFRALLGRYPPMAVHVIDTLGKRLRAAHNIIRGLAGERVEQRVASILLKLADRIGEQAGEGLRLNIHLTRQDIADMVGSTVETAIRIMSRFQKEGIVTTDEGQITIRDRARLKEIAERLP